jgi:hypothetical protein
MATGSQLQNDVIEELRERIAQHEQAMRQCLIDMEIDDPNLIDFTLDELVAHYAVKGWDTLRLSLQTCKRRGERIRELEAETGRLSSRLNDALEIIDVYIDDNPCRFDHHGFCQEHNLAQMNDGRCGNAAALELRTALGDV